VVLNPFLIHGALNVQKISATPITCVNRNQWWTPESVWKSYNTLLLSFLLTTCTYSTDHSGSMDPWLRTYLHVSTTAVFFNLCSANSFLGSLKMLKIVLYGTFIFRQVIRNFQEVPRIEKGWKTLYYRLVRPKSRS